MERIIRRTGKDDLEVSSYRGGICLNREGLMTNICLTHSETLELLKAIKEIVLEPRHIVLLPFKKAALTDWKYFYINSSGGIDYTDTAADVWEDGRLTSEQLESLDENIKAYAIPAEEFKQNEIGEF
jgi:hypothetical protein